MPAALVVELEFRAFAVAGRGPAGGEADGIVGRDFGGGAAITAVGGWPRITEQEGQFAGVLAGIAEIDPIEAEIRERAGCGRLAGFPIDIAGGLANLLAPSDAGRGGRRVSPQRLRAAVLQQQIDDQKDRSRLSHGLLSFGSIGLPALQFGVFTRNTDPRIDQTQPYKFQPSVMAITSFGLRLAGILCDRRL